ncbi:hypothetical protein [Dasania marina]|uniref:hypothetical protein n=1 Tax=Dasania marina TaxID=471499 RepID=UPI0030DD5205|tara:strand:- start:6662 stop:7555 length:894 start_codon:yes stop_codon:yes gene_type:complete
MTNSKKIHKKNYISLKELNWFNFEDNGVTQKTFTIWQAIAFIMKELNINDTIIAEYENLLSELEHDSLFDLFKDYLDEGKNIHSKDGEKLKQVLPDDLFEIEYLNTEQYFIEESEREEYITLLNDNRKNFTNELETPSIIYGLLRGGLFNNDDNTSISKKELKKWSSMSTINNLGLVDKSLTHASKKTRNEVFENQQKTLGVLIHSLCKIHPDNFLKNQKPNISSIVKFIELNVISDSTNFPKTRALTDIIAKASKSISDEVQIRERLIASEGPRTIEIIKPTKLSTVKENISPTLS